MNKNFLFTLCAILFGIVIIFKVNECNAAASASARSSQDEDDFGEFELDDEAANSNNNNNNNKKKSNEQKVGDKLNAKKEADFSNFDESNEEEDDAEFENKDIKSPTPKPTAAPKQQQKQQQKQEQNVKFGMQDDLDMEEFEHFVDDEEFETLETSSSQAKTKDQTKKGSNEQKKGGKSQETNKMPNLKIADVPKHLISSGNWQNYVWELCMIGIIAIYFANFIYGKSKNYNLATSWFQANRELLEKNFCVVGDDGSTPDLPASEQQKEQTENEGDQESTGPSKVGTLIKDSENSYGLWCSGRQSCDGMLVQLKLIKRQDLINGLIMQLIKPQSDQIIISVEYPSRDSLDNFVFCMTNKKISQRLFNDYQDLATYCSEKKTLPTQNGAGAGVGAFSGDYKYADLLKPSVASKYVMLNECGEVPNYILDMRVCAFLNNYPDMVEYLLISDQFVGYKVQANEEQSGTNASSGSSADSSPTTPSSQSESSAIGLPKARPILILCLNIPGRGLSTTSEDMERMAPALQLALYLLDKAPRIRLSKEAKAKTMKKRKFVSEQFLKLTHKQRQEAAMLRKEEKRRENKEKIMNESDPEKQKRLEEKELKKEKRKNLAKMKQVKIKAM